MCYGDRNSITLNGDKKLKETKRKEGKWMCLFIIVKASELSFWKIHSNHM